jgi:hypothetical protein
VTEEQLLRALLGEDIPVGGDETDTLFTDAEIAGMVQTYGSADEARAQGWEIKAARLSHLVDITEGSTSRSLSKAFDHAMSMAEKLRGGLLGSQKAGAKQHRIEREYGSF